jgi:GH35 family endo-1,4-beta-xylanase
MMHSNSLAHRKQAMIIHVCDIHNRPLARQEIQVTQLSHEFLFGCGAFETMHIVEPKDEASRAFYQKRYDLWLKLFNMGTLPFYWGQFEPEEGETIAATVEKMAKYLYERGITLKGHPLCWHTRTAPWLLDQPDAVVLQKQLERIMRDIGQFKHLIHIWDVINEVVIMPEFDKYDNAITRICRRYGSVGLVKQVFEAARQADPEATLIINDFNTSERYARLIEECLIAEVPIDVIGIQSHQHQGYWGDEKLEEVLERFSAFGLPIHFTENTFISGKLMPPDIVDLNDYKVDSWPTEAEAEERQARDVEHFYRRLFACPSVQAVTTWAFQDNAWLHAPAGMVRVDNSVKPAYEVLDHLINKEWKTRTTLITDEKGIASFFGFRGTYEISIRNQKFTFDSSKNEVSLTLG